MTICAHIFRLKKDRAGSVAVEAALVMPFLIGLGFAAGDASMMLVHNHKTETQLALASTYLASSRTPEDHETAAKRLAVTGQIETGGSPLIPGWSEADITVTYSSVANSDDNGEALYRGDDNIRVVRVTTEYNYSGFGFLKAVSGGDVQIKASFEERMISGSSA